jgi:hypothetical protein
MATPGLTVKILWAPNPLRTIVELEDPDRKVLCVAIAASYGSVDTADLHDLCISYEQALREIHEGDCTCTPCGCSKCGAERFLGINTIPGLTKYLAYQTKEAFGEGGERSLNTAIEALANYIPRPSLPMSDNRRALLEWCLPSWREEARRARTWLMAYRDRYFPER